MTYLRHATLVTSILVLTSSAPAFAQGPPTTVVEYYHLDAVGSVRAVTDQSGQVVRRHDYFPFGDGSDGTAAGADHLRFTGKERDAETGLDYFGARYYASRSGRFTTVDPAVPWATALQDPQLWNRYAYVRNNPLRHTDPDGRCIWDLCAAEGTGAYLVGAAAVATTAWLVSPAGQEAVSQVVNDTRTMITTGAGVIQSWFQSDGGDKSAAQPGTYRADRTLPQDPRTGLPIGEKTPDGTLAGEHTQIGKKTSGDPKVGDYTKGREFDANGRRVKDIDFTDHGRPKDHPNPHQHRYDPKTGKRLPPEELNPK